MVFISGWLDMAYPKYKNLLSELGMSATQLDQLLGNFRPRKVEKEQTILDIGEPFADVFILKQGCMRCYYLTPEGEQSNKLFFFEEDIVFPVAPIARHLPSLFSIAACEPLLILRMPLIEFKQYLRSLNLWQSFYLAYLEWLVDSRIVREHKLLTLNKNQLILDLIDNEPQVIQRIKDYHIASYLGMSPVTYSRLKPHS